MSETQTEFTPVNPILQFFNYSHLPEKLQKVSARFFRLAYMIEVEVKEGPGKEMAFRKLLESKDCAVRAAL